MRQKQIKTHYIQWCCLHCMRCDTTNPSACATSCDYVVDVWLISQRSPDSHRVPDDPVQTLSVSKNAPLKSKPLETISSGYSLNWDTSARFCLHADLVIGSANILSFSTSMLFLCGTTKVMFYWSTSSAVSKNWVGWTNCPILAVVNDFASGHLEQQPTKPPNPI